MGILLLQNGKLLLPLFISFQRQEQIGLLLVHLLQEKAVFFVGSKYIAHQDRDRILGIISFEFQDLFLGKNSIRVNLNGLIYEIKCKHSQDNIVPCAVNTHRENDYQIDEQDEKAGLHPWKVKTAHPPFIKFGN